jgi:hypothetical protein
VDAIQYSRSGRRCPRNDAEEGDKRKKQVIRKWLSRRLEGLRAMRLPRSPSMRKLANVIECLHGAGDDLRWQAHEAQ